MAKSPDGPGGTAVSLGGGGYPQFNDKGGPTGSEKVYEGTDTDLLGSDRNLVHRIAQELAPPPNYLEPGALFGDDEGSAFEANKEGVVASIACLIYAERIAELRREMNSGELARYQEIARDAVRINALGRTICDCPIQDSIGFCPIANGGVYSKRGRRFNPINTRSASELVGATNSKYEVDRMGAIAISEQLVKIRSLRKRVRGPEAKKLDCKSSITEAERLRIYAIIDHFDGWIEKYSPIETQAIKTEKLRLPI